MFDKSKIKNHNIFILVYYIPYAILNIYILFNINKPSFINEIVIMISILYLFFCKFWFFSSENESFSQALSQVKSRDKDAKNQFRNAEKFNNALLDILSVPTLIGMFIYGHRFIFSNNGEESIWSIFNFAIFLIIGTGYSIRRMKM